MLYKGYVETKGKQSIEKLKKQNQVENLWGSKKT